MNKRIQRLTKICFKWSLVVVIMTGSHFVMNAQEMQQVPDLLMTKLDEEVKAIPSAMPLRGVGYTIAETFPDSAMAQAVANTLSSGDVNTIITQEMIDNTVNLYLYTSGITDATGIEIFTNLERLDLSGNQLTSFDNIVLVKLHFLIINNNRLASIDVAGLANLKTLDVSNNQLATLNVSGCIYLEYLRAHMNQLTSLDLKGLTSLEYLELWDNQLASLNVEELVNLKYAYFNSNQLTSINVSGLTNLIDLSLDRNQLANINVSGLANLQYLWAESNQLTNIDVTGLFSLQGLVLTNNQLTSLPINILDLNNLPWLELGNNLLPSNYQSAITLPNWNQIFVEQNQLLLTPTTYTITKVEDLNSIDLHAIVSLRYNENPLSRGHQFIFENYVDTNGEPVNIDDYIQNGIILETGTVFAQVRSTGTGLFPNNSDHALTAEKVQLDFVKSVMYNVTFDLNGGVGTVPSIQELYEGTSITPPAILPTREGFTFSNWNTKIDGSGVSWNFTSDKMPNADITLYAQWKKIGKVVTSPNDTINQPTNLPKTGATSSPTGFVFLLLGSALIGIGSLYTRKRK